MAIMFWLFLLQVINSFEGLSGAEHETLCTSNACFTLHTGRVKFREAHQKCVDNGGSLMTVRDRREEHVLSLLVSQFHRHHRGNGVKFWIGLKLPSANCVSADKPLRGFEWVSGEEDSQYSNWEKEPVVTCTEERCVRVNYTLSSQNQLTWIAGSCKTRIFYACKFYFRGMCQPLVLMGPGQITYILPFSEKPESRPLKSFPVGTYANTVCSDQQSHYSVCMRINDLYHWTDPGPFCKSGKQNCSIGNGGCEHECRQDADEVRCFCKEGYDLGEDALSCRTKDLCSADTCEHQCVMGESGYFCSCSHGYRLDENQRTCSDVDECQSQVCDGHPCENVQGSYVCACEDGYEMVDGKCSDVDECAQSRCEHSCLNSVGSFSCDCNEGFALAEDGHSCVDVNECVFNRCQFTCFNSVGSFRCGCPHGFHLEADGLNCALNVAQTLTASPKDPPDEEANSTESSIRATVELQHQSPHTDAPPPDLVNVTHGNQQRNASLSTSSGFTVDPKVMICVLGSVIPLLVLIAVTLAIAIFRCSRSKKEAKKNMTADGYCWVSSGLDPRLEKLYESILTDDL
ncbi:complement component C1q receptor [Anabas testudineus]|uniref:complement component C1q receptor n=1 Tax=Anabas testudineus TaxID=64144 RepID=UPI000E45E14C|nr:complement component C1q receptor [Anabas testudineus]